MTNIKEDARKERLKEETKNKLIEEVYSTKQHKIVDNLERQLSNKLSRISKDNTEVPKD